MSAFIKKSPDLKRDYKCTECIIYTCGFSILRNICISYMLEEPVLHYFAEKKKPLLSMRFLIKGDIIEQPAVNNKTVTSSSVRELLY